MLGKVVEWIVAAVGVALDRRFVELALGL